MDNALPKNRQYKKIFTIKMPLCLAEIYLSTHCFGTEKVLGKGLENIVFEIKNGEITGYFSEDDIEKVGLNSMVKLQNNNFISKIKTESFAAARKLWDNSIYIDSINLSNLIKQELSQLYTEQIQLIRDVYAFFNVSSPAVSLAIEKRLEELTKQAKISDDGLNKLKTKSLIAQENFLEKEENDLKKIVAKINENQTLREIFLNTTDKELIIILARDYAEYDNLITLHAKKYDFLQGYVDFNKFDKKYYLYRLKKILSNEQTKNNQLLDELSHWLNLTHYFSNHRMEMRIYYTKGLVSLKKILDEIAKRMNIGVEDAKYLLIEENTNFLNSGVKVPNHIVTKRQEYSIYLIQDKKPVLLVGEETQEFSAKYLPKSNIQNATQIHGVTANKGQASGRAIIFRNETNLLQKMNEMRKGDILITINTRPDMMIACNKASAIVAEEGGILSHAALVSRELCIPCILNAKEATKIFKDGDMVEVDADKGVVRKNSKLNIASIYNFLT